MSILNVIQPLVVNPILACIIGLNETIVLQQINYWLTINSRANKGQYEGKTWTYSSLDQWKNNNFPFWSTKTIQRTLTSLKKKNLILSIENPTNKMDRRLWYTINEEGLKNLEIEYAKKEKEYCRRAGGCSAYAFSKAANGYVPSLYAKWRFIVFGRQVR